MLREIDDKKDIIRNFMPSWFASVMGTGILAMTSLFYSTYIPALADLALYLVYFNLLLFIVLLIPWTLRWILFPQNAIADLNHPVLANFYATIAIAMLVLAANFIVVLNNMLVGQIFWFAGTLATVFFAVIVPYKMFQSETVTLDHINPAWFIPPVGLIVIPIAGGLLINEFSGMMQEFVIFLNYFGWGAGFFIYLALLAMCMYRFILHKPLPNNLVPTLWITLGPIGAGIVSLIALVQNSTFITMEEPFLVFCLLFWGFGIWWLFLAAFITLDYKRRSQLSYALSWWAFTFPLGAYVAATYKVSQLFNLQLVNHIGFALYWLLFFFWITTLIKTLKNSYHGTLFKAH